MSKPGLKLRTWHGNRPWYLVDERGHVRFGVRRCVQTEAEALALAMLGERMTAYRRTKLTLAQRAEFLDWPLTFQQYLDRFSLEVPLDLKERQSLRAKARAARAFREAGKGLAAGGGA